VTPIAIVKFVFQASIMLTVFGFGLEASLDDLLYLLRRPGLLLRSLVAMFVVMPVFAIFMASVFSFDRAVVVALVVISISPIPPALPKKVTKAVGEGAYGLGLMVTAASLSIAYIPLATYLIGRYLNKPFSMDPAAVAKLIGLSVLIPLAAGIVSRKFAPAIAIHFGPTLVRIAEIGFLIGLLSVLAFALPTAWSLVGNGTLMGLIAFVLVGLLVGHLLGGPSPDERVTLGLSTACRHPGLALAIASANVPEERGVVSAVILYLLANAILTIPYVKWQRKEVRDHATV
jgi:bile acid:Na+ symporter, BASS family